MWRTHGAPSSSTAEAFNAKASIPIRVTHPPAFPYDAFNASRVGRLGKAVVIRPFGVHRSDFALEVIRKRARKTHDGFRVSLRRHIDDRPRVCLDDIKQAGRVINLRPSKVHEIEVIPKSGGPKRRGWLRRVHTQPG